MIVQAKNVITLNNKAPNNPVIEFVLQEGLFDYLIARKYLFSEIMLKRYPRAQKMLYEFKNTYLRSIIETNFSSGVILGLYQPDLNISRTTEIYLKVTDSLLFNQLRPGRELFDALQIFIRGIVTIDGLNHLNNYRNKRES